MGQRRCLSGWGGGVVLRQGLTIYPKLSSNSQSFCPEHSLAGVIVVHHHIQPRTFLKTYSELNDNETTTYQK